MFLWHFLESFKKSYINTIYYVTYFTVIIKLLLCTLPGGLKELLFFKIKPPHSYYSKILCFIRHIVSVEVIEAAECVIRFSGYRVRSYACLNFMQRRFLPTPHHSKPKATSLDGAMGRATSIHHTHTKKIIILYHGRKMRQDTLEI